MKQILIAILLCIFTQGVKSQVEDSVVRNKNGVPVLPSAGDFAIGVDAIPYFEFLGNSFNNTSSNNLSLSKTTLYGKYYLTDNSAVRAELYLNTSKDQNTSYVSDDSQVLENPNAQVEDLQIINNNNYGIGVGYQQYRGYHRLRGTYGAVASYYYNRYTTRYTWGNKMTPDNAAPTSTNWYEAGTKPTSRNLEQDNDISQTISVGVICGVEYFILPRVCLGGEFGIYAGYTWNSQSDLLYETVDGQGNYQEMELAQSPTDNYFSVSTQAYDNNRVAGRLYLLFHF